jgi:triacylglycerol esterase/lipase EstA (alpha/beta hydrolase family)
VSSSARRRQLLLVWLGAFVVLAVAIVATVVVNNRSSSHASPPAVGSTPSSASPTGTSAPPSPSASARGSAPPTSPISSPSASIPPRPPDDRPGPVILVPGYGGDAQMLDPLASRLRKAGRTAIVLDLPNAATGDLRGQEQVLAAQVSAQLQKGATSVDLVGYSAGGIVVALYVEADPSHVRRVVTLGSPLHGTRVAGLAAGLVPSACPTACEQMVPGSPLLASLADASPDKTGVPWLSMWTSHDEVVLPADSARFTGARNVELQTICADDATGHTTLPADPLAIGLTVQTLDTSPLPLPTPPASECAALRALAG